MDRGRTTQLPHHLESALTRIAGLLPGARPPGSQRVPPTSPLPLRQGSVSHRNHLHTGHRVPIISPRALCGGGGALRLTLLTVTLLLSRALPSYASPAPEARHI